MTRGHGALTELDGVSVGSRIVTIVLFVLILGPPGPMPIETAPRTDTIDPGVSSSPTVEVLGGSVAERKRVDVALDRFSDAGLLLPDLQIVFAGKDEYGEALGRFQDHATPWRIVVCSRYEFVYEHELAHAWDRANLSDETRDAFMAGNGYAAWSGKGLEWNQRGVEGVARVVQRGVSGLPLPAIVGEGNGSMPRSVRAPHRPAGAGPDRLDRVEGDSVRSRPERPQSRSGRCRGWIVRGRAMSEPRPSRAAGDGQLDSFGLRRTR